MKYSGQSLYEPDLVHVTLFNGIKKGDLVKVSDMKNAFWVKVIEAHKSKINGSYYFVGVIENELPWNDIGYDLGDLIQFDDSNVLDLEKKVRKPRKPKD